MEADRALKRILESLAHQFSGYSYRIEVLEGDRFDVSGPYKIKLNFDVSSYLRSKLSELLELRVLIDRVSHLVEHINSRDYLPVYEYFVKKHLESPTLAYTAISCVEDVYVDLVRTKRYPGLRKACAFHNYTLLSKVLPPTNAYQTERSMAIAGLIHLSLCGVVKGETTGRVTKVLEECKSLLTKSVSFHSIKERCKIAEKIYDLIYQLPGEDEASYPHMDVKVSGVQLNITNQTESDSEGVHNKQCTCPNLQDNPKNLSDWFNLPQSEFENFDELNSYEMRIIQTLQESVKEERVKTINGKVDRELRDILVDKSFRVEIPEHVKNELYYLLYQIKTKDRRVRSEIGEYVDVSNYIRYKCGEFNVPLYYEMRTDDIGDRALLLVIDQSSSMKGEKIEKAKIAAHILATACSELGDKIAMFAFSEPPFSKTTCEITPILLWGERYSEEYLSLINAVGHTPLREAIKVAKEWISTVDAREKTVIVITDGDPTTSTKSKVLQRVNELRLMGVEVIGLGIGKSIDKECLKSCFGENGYVWVPEVEDLPQELVRVYLMQKNVRW